MRQWLGDLKLALIEEDEEKITQLLAQLPGELGEGAGGEELLTQLAALLGEAEDFFTRKRSALAAEIHRIQNAKKYLG